MNMDTDISIKTAASRDDAELVGRLAEIIWTEHYTPIIGPAQVEYMLRKFQGADDIYRDMADNGYTYLVAFSGGRTAGYCAAKPDPGAGEVFLSKLYVEKSFRGRGISRGFLKLVTELAEKENCSHIRLTVNKSNSDSIAAYKKMGFRIVASVVTDIGGGFVMDDYIMRLDLQPAF